MAEKKEAKTYKKVDAELKNKVKLIVEELYIQESSRDTVNEILKQIKEDYGIKSTIMRKVARSMFLRNKEEIEKDTDELLTLIEELAV